MKKNLILWLLLSILPVFGQVDKKEITNSYGEPIDTISERLQFKTKLQLENVDNTADASKPISSLTQSALNGKANIDFLNVDPFVGRRGILAMPLPHEESLDSRTLVHDAAIGVEQTLTAAQTRVVRPGPGTMAARVVTSPSLVRYENKRLIITHAAASGYGTDVNWGPQTLSPGITAIFRVIPAFQPGAGGQTVLGWSVDGSSNASRGSVSLTYDGSAPYRVSNVAISTLASSSDANFTNVWNYLFEPGQEVAVAVRHTSATLVEYYLQSPVLANCGCSVGSENWFKLGQTSGTSLSGTVYPYVYHQYGGATQVLDVKVLSEWNPSPRHQQFSYERGKIGVHVPALMRDPASGLMVAAWNVGTTHVDEDTKIVASVELASGIWTNPSTIVAAPGGSAGVHIGSLSSVNSQLWLTHWLSPTAADGGIYRKRVLTIDPSNGGITVGSEQVMSGIEGVTECLSFAPILTTDSGTLLFFYNNFGDSVASVARSTNGGSTWSLVNMTPGGVPVGATAIYEPFGQKESGGAIGVYLRAHTGGSTYYQRSIDDGLTWSVPVPVLGMPQPTIQNGGRYSGATSPDGRNWIVGHGDNRIRRTITIYEVGDNASIRGSYEIFNPYPDNAADVSILTHYPVISFEGDDLISAWSNQTGTDSWIQLHKIRWTEPLSIEAGGTGSRAKYVPKVKPRDIPKIPSPLVFGASPTPDKSVADRFILNLTASTATVAAPLNPVPWEDLEIIVVQGGSGGYTLAWNSIYEFNANSPRLKTAIGSTTVFVFRYNPISNKWVHISAPVADKTVIASGTTGNQTINSRSGRVNFAASATSLVVTNSLVTANSIIICQVNTADASMRSCVAVPAAGSFTIYPTNTPAAETSVSWIVDP